MQSIDIEDFDVNEIIVLEEETGLSVEDLMAAGQPRGKVLRAINFVVLRREDPDVTIEDAGKVKLGELMEALGSDEDEPGNE